MVDAHKIHDNGWRQGSIVRNASHDFISELAGIEIPDGSLCILVSHSCDVVHHNIENEPFADILVARPSDKPDGMLQSGKNPRKLQFQIDGEHDSELFVARQADLVHVDRTVLENHDPDVVRSIAETELYVVVSWLGNRYSRSAFPSSFDERINIYRKELRKCLKKEHEAVTAIYLYISSDDELEEDDDYDIALLWTVRDETYADAERLKKVQMVADEVGVMLADCDGVNVLENVIQSENNTTVADIRMTRAWYFDDLSLSEDPPLDQPLRRG